MSQHSQTKVPPYQFPWQQSWRHWQNVCRVKWKFTWDSDRTTFFFPFTIQKYLALLHFCVFFLYKKNKLNDQRKTFKNLKLPFKQLNQKKITTKTNKWFCEALAPNRTQWTQILPINELVIRNFRIFSEMSLNSTLVWVLFTPLSSDKRGKRQKMQVSHSSYVLQRHTTSVSQDKELWENVM